MKHLGTCLTLAIAAGLTASLAFADEGMWPLYDLDKLPFDTLKAHGLTLEPSQIYNPAGTGLADAVINLSGGTASFLSSDGLIITNHHVAFDAIQRQSTIEHNYIRDGFYARTGGEEIPAIGFNVYVTLAIEDVTKKIMAKAPSTLAGRARHDAIENATKRIVKEAEKGRDVQCEVAEMFGGMQYMLYTYFKIRDVRLVYAPPEAIGNFGGDIDNWMWPRHVGDFSFLRAYVGPNGKSAEYSDKNVPYHPKVFLPISSAGVKEGDFTMMIGMPGSTRRYTSSFDIANAFGFYYPASVQVYHDVIEILKDESSKDSSVAIRLDSRINGMSNFYLKNQGLIEGSKRMDILRIKREQERELTDFIKTSPELTAKFGTVLSELDSLYRERSKTREEEFVLGWMQYSCEYFGLARRIYKWGEQREKPDMERESGYQNRDTIRTKESLKNTQINLVPAADKRIFRYYLGRVLELPESQKIAAIEALVAGITGAQRESYLDHFVDSLYQGTKIGILDERMKMFGLKKTELERLGDPFINFVASLTSEFDQNDERSKQSAGAHSILDPKLIQAYVVLKNGKLYPDANGTKRFNWGQVVGYSPRDGVRYNYLTTLKGVMEKETGKFPFVVPAELKQAYQKKDFGRYADAAANDMPVNFITCNSGTNGNSGSPVINGKGELIGLDFDTDYEGVSADYMYNPDLARAVVCDARYILFLLDKVYHLDGLLRELTIH